MRDKVLTNLFLLKLFVVGVMALCMSLHPNERLFCQQHFTLPSSRAGADDETTLSSSNSRRIGKIVHNFNLELF